MTADPRAAALYVCAHARDADDARLLLTALGLLDDGRLSWPQPGAIDISDIKQVYATGTRRGTYL